MDFNLFVIKQNWHILAHGAWMTFALCAGSLILGMILAVFLCAGRMRGQGFFFWISTVFVNMFRTLPELVPVFWIYSAGPLVFNLKLSATTSGIIALTIYVAAFVAEIYRAGVNGVPSGQMEAARALGMPATSIWVRVIVPQAIKLMIPPFMNFLCDLVKVSSLLSAIGIAELAYQATIVGGDTLRFFEIYTVAGAFYFAILYPFSLMSRYFEKRMSRSHA